jgi:hypothetical protein
VAVLRAMGLGWALFGAIQAFFGQRKCEGMIVALIGGVDKQYPAVAIFILSTQA